MTIYKDDRKTRLKFVTLLGAPVGMFSIAMFRSNFAFLCFTHSRNQDKTEKSRKAQPCLTLCCRCQFLTLKWWQRIYVTCCRFDTIVVLRHVGRQVECMYV